MTNNKPSKQASFLDKFNSTLDRLAKNKKNGDLNNAIKSWCAELSIDKYFPQASKEIVDTIYQLIQYPTIGEIFLDIYRNLLAVTDQRNTKLKLAKDKVVLGNWVVNFSKITKSEFHQNINEAKNKMSIKSILLIAFILTGIGLLLFILKQKQQPPKPNHRRINLPNPPTVKEKYILALLINSDKYQEVIDSLKNNGQIQPEDGSKLYSATQGLWIGTKSEFNKSQIKQGFDSPTLATTTSEYDVYFVTIELDSYDNRFEPNVNLMDRRDAFTKLSKLSTNIKVSPRLSAKAYEYTEFHNR